MNYNFETLVLLIGTNTLPNYVVAEFFLKINTNLKNIILIHSQKTEFQEGTQQQAENLEKVLKKKTFSQALNFPLVKIGLSAVGNAAKTWHELTVNLIPEINNSTNIHHIHLNYTGGTKVMCVHVYRFIENKMVKCLKSRIHHSFSYFDGRTFKIVDDGNESYISKDLRDNTDVSFSDIIEMHGFKFKRTPDSSLISETALSALQDKINDGLVDQLNSEIRDFYTELNTLKKKSPAEIITTEKCRKWNKYKSGPLFHVVRAMPEQFQFLDTNGSFDCSKLEKAHKSFTNFLNGKWLEHYIYFNLRTGFASEPDIAIEKDWEINKTGWSTFFQLDVILKKGFQLVGISCTISTDKAVCKHKGFEIFHRTRQIGGDESRALVVTLLDDGLKKIVEDELQKDSGCPEGYICVVGRKDLKSNDLLKRVKKFLR